MTNQTKNYKPLSRYMIDKLIRTRKIIEFRNIYGETFTGVVIKRDGYTAFIFVEDKIAVMTIDDLSIVK